MTPRTIFAGVDAAGQTVFAVQVRRNNGNYQVRAQVAGSAQPTGWYGIGNNAYTAIEITWQAGSPGSFSLSTGGTLRQTLSGITNGAFTLDAVRLGIQGPFNGLNNRTWYFDSFSSARRILP